MNYVGKFFSNVKGFYNEINSATLTGAIDVVIIQQEDGSYISSPWHVRFGKMGVLRAREKLVDIEINGEPVDLHMKLGEGGAAFFVQESEDAEVPAHLATSPLPSTLELMEQGISDMKKSITENDDVTPTNPSQLLHSVTDPNLLSLNPNPIEDGLKRATSASNMSTQTEMTATEVECKVARSRPSSISEDKPKIEKEKVKRKKRRKGKRDDKESNDLPVMSASSDFPEEVLFDLEMSSEEDDALMLPGVSHSMSLPIIDEKLARTDEWASSQFASAFHPFSDGDITPIISPVGSRPPSPKSDTEFENQKFDAHAQTKLTGDDMAEVDDVKWAWGELPTSEAPSKPGNTTQTEEGSSGGLLSFMRKTKKARHQPEQEGIYLEDLNLDQMDPEVAALYLYHGKGSKTAAICQDQEDTESGRGASLPQSPVPHDHTIVRPTPQLASIARDVAMSLCGGVREHTDITAEKFDQYFVTYDQFCEDPAVINDPNLVIRLNDKYYTWEVAGPVIMSFFCFQQSLSSTTLDNLVKQHMPHPSKKEKKRGWGLWGWRGTTEDVSTQATEKKGAGVDQATSTLSSPSSSIPGSPAKSSLSSSGNHEMEKDDRKDSETESEHSDKLIQITVAEPVPIKESEENLPVREKFRKSLKLTSEDVLKLNLKEGMNEASFSVTTQYQGTCRCNCYIYVWKWNDRIIVSDIDGTITKSDVLGQVLPMIGKDWSQEGIAGLYNMIHGNGYKFVYLSARAIGQSRITRDYLRSLRQGELSLPDGPLLLSPSSLISAFHREVIERKPEEFKISCLKDIAALFPESTNPFYSGFGNKINDTWAYRAVGIPISRVFTVNHRGELRMELHSTFQSSYSKLSDVVDHFFPPLLDRVPKQSQSKSKMLSGNFPAAQEYSTFTYWREPLPDIADELPDFSKTAKSTNVRKKSVDVAPVAAADADTEK